MAGAGAPLLHTLNLHTKPKEKGSLWSRITELRRRGQDLNSAGQTLHPAAPCIPTKSLPFLLLPDAFWQQGPCHLIIHLASPSFAWLGTKVRQLQEDNDLCPASQGHLVPGIHLELLASTGSFMSMSRFCQAFLYEPRTLRDLTTAERIEGDAPKKALSRMSST